MVTEGVTGTTTGCMTAVGADESEHADVEDLDELEGIDGGLLDIGVCEIEVEGIIHKVEGDRMSITQARPPTIVSP